MPSQGIGAYSVKIHQIVFGGLLFLLVLAGVKGMMYGGAGDLKQLGALTLATGVVLALDKYYWVMFIALPGFAVKIPGLPFDGAELGCIFLIAVYFIRQAMHKERPIRPTADLLMALPVFAWIVLVWFMNPTGMAMLGSSSIGARFYLRIVLGYLALHVLSAIRLSESDCKILFRLLFISAVYSMLETVFGAEISTLGGEGEAGVDERAGRYEFLGAMYVYLVVLSRFSLPEILRSASKTALVVACTVLTIYTGKRRGLGTLILVPLFRSWLTWKDKMVTVCVGVVAGVMLLFIVSGHGTFYELPRSAQRSLAIFVPAFADKAGGGMTDLFRESMRQHGREVIRANPWFGRKGFAMDRAETSWVVFSSQSRNYTAGHAFSGNWHSTWYAFAADFGIPCAVLWGVFLLYSLVVGFKAARQIPPWTYAGGCCLYFVMAMFLDAAFSYTSGHSSYSSMSAWRIFGMFLAVRNGFRDAQPPALGQVAT